MQPIPGKAELRNRFVYLAKHQKQQESRSAASSGYSHASREGSWWPGSAQQQMAYYTFKLKKIIQLKSTSYLELHLFCPLVTFKAAFTILQVAFGLGVVPCWNSDDNDLQSIFMVKWQKSEWSARQDWGIRHNTTHQHFFSW